MNDAHLHLVLNHFPIIGSIFGLVILIAGLILKNNSVKNTAYILFMVSAIFAAFSIGTGEGAEEMVEDMPNIGKQIIHEHEEIAEKFALVLYLMAAVSLAGLIMNLKNYSKAKFVSYVAVVIAIIAVVVSTQVGTSGGEIRHTEIRDDSVNTKVLPEGSISKEQTKEDDEK
ncbi:putative membrane protein [Flavobacterium sp. CG_23.5]|uniref:hypothetical protein n=1 Tax=unclassified Flavobacterium TaxID=196869 RepID=UPI0018CB8414|nr:MULTISPECIES: hypothetical protein [unclassified Flavobacterium]MBG6111388.1 putative membrane protein [Flavobacterium sp. CG_9.10]MBP2282174.1 putative membrane protein [Flavobacterium sp. CG_23.5]